MCSSNGQSNVKFLYLIKDFLDLFVICQVVHAIRCLHGQDMKYTIYSLCLNQMAVDELKVNSSCYMSWVKHNYLVVLSCIPMLGLHNC